MGFNRLIRASETFRDTAAEIFELLHKERLNYFCLINGMVKMAQDARVSKDYATSDAIRELLKESGIEIIQGTPEYEKFADIPKELIGRPIVDTWNFIKQKA